MNRQTTGYETDYYYEKKAKYEQKFKKGTKVKIVNIRGCGYLLDMNAEYIVVNSYVNPLFPEDFSRFAVEVKNPETNKIISAHHYRFEPIDEEPVSGWCDE